MGRECNFIRCSASRSLGRGDDWFRRSLLFIVARSSTHARRTLRKCQQAVISIEIRSFSSLSLSLFLFLSEPVCPRYRNVATRGSSTGVERSYVPSSLTHCWHTVGHTSMIVRIRTHVRTVAGESIRTIIQIMFFVNVLLYISLYIHKEYNLIT